MRNEIKKSAGFVVNGVRITIDSYRREEQDGSHLSFTGEIEGGYGQNDKRIREVAGHVPDVALLLGLWDTYHLKAPAPASAFKETDDALNRLDGQHFGRAPDVSEAPEIGGDVFDSRDVIPRFEIYRQAVVDLGIREEDVDTFDNGANWPDYMPEDPDSEADEIIREFLDLRQLMDEGESNCEDWRGGATIVRESHFEDYARELADDIGAIDSEASWPNTFIDWTRAADALKIDYSELEYGGETYLAR
jgi:hypothetical protein